MEEDKKILMEQVQFIYNNYYAGIDEELLLKATKNILNELEILQKEFEAVDHECSRLEQKEIELENKKCLHCGNNTPLYCEKCQQELITKNAELQLEIEKLKKKHKMICGLNVELLENIEYFIPKQVIRNKIQLLEKELKLLDENDKHTIIENDYIISVLKELLGE